MSNIIRFLSYEKLTIVTSLAYITNSTDTKQLAHQRSTDKWISLVRSLLSGVQNTTAERGILVQFYPSPPPRHTA
jgi:hypothetical protein